MNPGVFCEVYGATLRNRVVEHILERGTLDFAVRDLLEEIPISKPRLYAIVAGLEAEQLVVASRRVGSTQLYVLNGASVKVQVLKRAFQDCLRSVSGERRPEGWKVKAVA